MAGFYESIAKELEKSLVKELSEIRKAAGSEKIYAAALVADSRCVCVSLSANTLEFLKVREREYAESHKADLSVTQIIEAEKGNSSLTKWLVAEWGYSDAMNGRKSSLAKISKLLSEHNKKDPDIHKWSEDIFFETAASAFRRAIEKYPLTADPDDVTYFITKSDGNASAIENSAAKLLNSRKVYEEFFRRGNI